MTLSVIACPGHMSEISRNHPSVSSGMHVSVSARICRVGLAKEQNCRDAADQPSSKLNHCDAGAKTETMFGCIHFFGSRGERKMAGSLSAVDTYP